jgi:fibronectin-binding autotransporter adhesin
MSYVGTYEREFFDDWSKWFFFSIVFAVLLAVFLAGPWSIAHAQTYGSGDVVPANPNNWTPATVGYIGYNFLGSLTVSYLECSDAYLGYNPGSEGDVTVSGIQGYWWLHNGLYVGKGGRGTLTVTGRNDTESGAVSCTTGYLGVDPGSNGTVTLSGFRSDWNIYDKLYVGNSGTGTLHVQAGAEVTCQGICYLGFNSGSVGAATIENANSMLNVSNSDLYIGNSGTGNLNVLSGGQLYSKYGFLGYNANSSGTVIVSGSGSKWTTTNSLMIGMGGEGTLIIQDGGQVSSLGGAIGEAAGSKGTVILSGAASKWTPGGLGIIGYWGSGTVNVLDGAQYDGYSYENCNMAYRPGSQGTLNVFGSGSKFTMDTLYVGRSGSGTLNIGDAQNAGGIVAAKTLVLAMNNGSSGTCNLSNGGTLQAESISGRPGQNFNWNDGAIQNYNMFYNLSISTGLAFRLAATGRHVFEISDQRTGTVNAILSDATSGGSLTKAGAGILLLAANNTYTGPTTIEEGSLAVTGSILGTSGITVHPTGTLVLTKPDSVPANMTIDNDGTISIANSVTLGAITGTGVTKVCQNGSLTAASIVQDSLIIGGSSAFFNGDVTPNDPAAWKTTTISYVGQSARGEAVLSTQAKLTCNKCYLGYNPGSVGELTVVSGGSRISSAGLYVGYAGSGELTVGQGGLVLMGTLRLANDASSEGAVVIKHGGILQVGTIAQGDGIANFQWDDGTIKNYPSASTLTIADNVVLKLVGGGKHIFNIDPICTATVNGILADATAGASLTKIGAGTLTLAAANTYSGGTMVEAGRLIVTGSILNASEINVAFGATLELATSADNATSAALAIDNDGAILISSGSQQVGVIAGTGVIQVNSDATLTAHSIVQDSLLIGVSGAATNLNHVPEPGSLAMLLAGAISAIVLVRRLH